MLTTLENSDADEFGSQGKRDIDSLECVVGSIWANPAENLKGAWKGLGVVNHDTLSNSRTEQTADGIIHKRDALHECRGRKESSQPAGLITRQKLQPFICVDICGLDN